MNPAPSPSSTAATQTHFEQNNFKIAAILLGGFIAVDLLVSLLMRNVFHSGFLTFVANVLLIAGTMFAYGYWVKRGQKISCPHCSGVILSDTHWVCGFCEKPNKDTANYSILSQCGHCGAKPKAYKCHHCGELIFFTEDHLKVNFAYCLNTVSEDVAQRQQAKEEFQSKKEKRMNDLEMAKLDAQVKAVEKESQEPKIKTEAERKVEALEQQYQRIMMVDEYAEKKKEEVSKTFANDPKKLEKAKEAIDNISRDHC